MSPRDAGNHPEEPSAHELDPVAVVLATAVAAGVSTAELESAIRGTRRGPEGESAGCPDGDPGGVIPDETAERLPARGGLSESQNPLEARRPA